MNHERWKSWSRIIAGALVVLSFSMIVSSQENYKTYVNARFDYSISYPANLLIPQGEADNADGQRFLSKDGKAELRVWGSYNVSNEKLKDAFERESSNSEGRTVSYKLLNGNWFVVSGTEDGRIFYQKMMLKGDVFKAFRIQYAESQKARFDQVVKRIEKSFKG